LERRFWESVPGSASLEEAGRAVGVSSRVVGRWLAESGGVKPRLCEPGFRLSFEERCQIEAMDEAGLSGQAIARKLNRSPSTISRELRRNRTVRAGGGYSARNAQHKADQRARRPKPTKLAENPALRERVQDRLKAEDSPEQIANRLVVDFPDDAEMRVSHETIYKALFVQGRGELRRDLAKRLRTGRAVRKPRRTVGERRGGIKDMVGISERPAEVEDRAVPGHWEGDLILGSVSSGSAIGTLVERASRYVMLLHLPHDHGADAVQGAMVEAMSRLPEELRQTLTWDQGREMANHVAIAAATDLDIYFCDPHSPWQRGTNENTNGLLRQYFPKGSDLSVYAPDYLEHVARKLNNRPRKTLNWATPAEALDALLSNPFTPPGVALTA
jgi:IS30 family transposase